MSSTIMVHGLSPSNGRKKESDASTLRLRTPATFYSKQPPMMASTSSSKATNHTGSPPRKAMSQAEAWVLKEKAARQGDMTPLDEKDPQRTPLGRAVALQAATCPTPMSSFPDSFWNPFLEQEEYNREKLAASSRRYRDDATRSCTGIKATNNIGTNTASVTPRKLEFQGMQPTNTKAKSARNWSFGITITTIFKLFIKACFYVSLGLLVSSLVDVPYFQRILQVLAFVGQVTLGLALWVVVHLKNDVLPYLQDLYRYLKDDFNGFLTMVKALFE